MALSPYFLHDSLTPSGSLENILSSFLQPFPTHSSLQTPILTIDFIDENENYLMKADVPGFKADDISVTTNNNIITISCSKNDEQKIKKNYFYSERKQSGTYSRSIRLPKDADSNKEFQAELDSGVLTIHIPKIDTKKDQSIQKKISIKTI